MRAPAGNDTIETPPSQPGHGQATGERLRVLLVHREAPAREALAGLLRAVGFQSCDCESAALALRQVTGFAPDIILADFDSDAPALLEGVRQELRKTVLPIVFFGGAEQQRSRFALIAAGADDFLPTPIGEVELAAALRSRVRRACSIEGQLPAGTPVAPRRGQLRRGEFLEQLGSVLRRPGSPWQVLIALRLDQGKILGEKLGQAAAFELEQAVAARFAGALQADDAYTLWMASGFGILALRDDRAQLEALCRELCQRIAAEPFEIRGQSFQLSASVGVALPPGGADAGDPDRWFAAAYAAQAIAHRLGGNRHDGVLNRDHGSMPAERVLIIREWVKEAAAGENVLIEFQPVLPLRANLAGLYSLDAKLRDYRAPLAGVSRCEYLSLARDAGALPMIDRMSLFSAFEAIEQERTLGQATRVMVQMDLATIGNAQLLWLDAEIRRRKAHADGLVIEFDADMALGQPELARVVQRLEDQGVAIAISDTSGGLSRIQSLQKFPAGLLRLPLQAIDSVPPAELERLLHLWRASGRGLIVDQVGSVQVVKRLWEMQIDYVRGEAIAASGPRLDYEFSQFAL